MSSSAKALNRLIGIAMELQCGVGRCDGNELNAEIGDGTAMRSGAWEWRGCEVLRNCDK